MKPKARDLGDDGSTGTLPDADVAQRIEQAMAVAEDARAEAARARRDCDDAEDALRRARAEQPGWSEHGDSPGSAHQDRDRHTCSSSGRTAVPRPLEPQKTGGCPDAGSASLPVPGTTAR